MRDLPSTIFAGCFMMAMAVFLPLILFIALVRYAVRGIWGRHG